LQLVAVLGSVLELALRCLLTGSGYPIRVHELVCRCACSFAWICFALHFSAGAVVSAASIAFCSGTSPVLTHGLKRGHDNRPTERRRMSKCLWHTWVVRSRSGIVDGRRVPPAPRQDLTFPEPTLAIRGQACRQTPIPNGGRNPVAAAQRGSDPHQWNTGSHTVRHPSLTLYLFLYYFFILRDCPTSPPFTGSSWTFGRRQWDESNQ